MIIRCNQTSWLDLVSRMLWKVALQVPALPARLQTLPCLLFCPEKSGTLGNCNEEPKIAHKTLGGTKDCTILYWYWL